MDALLPAQEQLDEWMFSNYSFIKTDSPKLIDFVDPTLLTKKRKDEPLGEKQVLKIAGQDVESQKAMTDDKANDFLKRAGVVKKNDATPIAEKSQRIRNVLNEIQSGVGSAEMDPDAEGVDPEAAREYRAAMESPEPDYSRDHFSSGIDFGQDDGMPPLEIQHMMAQHSNPSGANQKDLYRLRAMMEKKNSARDSFENGDNRGSSKGGGFSRA